MLRLSNGSDGIASTPLSRYDLAANRMNPDSPDDHPIERVLNQGEAAVAAVRKFFAGYFWIILKNVIGWLLIVLSLPAGALLPGPGGLPMFLIGFALVAVPGKRRFTSHVLRGRPVRIEAGIFTTLTTIASLIVIAGLLWLIGEKYQHLIAYFKLDPEKSNIGFVAAVIGLCGIAALVTWGMMSVGLLFVNKLLRILPRIRRMIRPFLRKWGVVLLPRRRRGATGEEREAGEILEFSQTSRERWARVWTFSRPWLRRFVGLGITAVLMYLVIEPIVRGWRQAEHHVDDLSPMDFAIGLAMGVGFLLAFRAGTWWVLLARLGHVIPGAAAGRIWVTSELARYLPSISTQIVSRANLVRHYGVQTPQAGTAHIIEITLFVLANAVFAVMALLLVGAGRTQNQSLHWWMVVAIMLMPLLLALMHPRVFYAVINRVLAATGQPKIERRIRGGTLAALMMWNVAGIAFLSLVLWWIASGPLGLPISRWWLLGGVYSIAWLAGFAAFWAPGGIGVREIVFMSLLLIALPPTVKSDFSPDAIVGFVAVLALVLRIWSMVCELILALGAYALDIDGALRSVTHRAPRSVARQG